MTTLEHIAAHLLNLSIMALPWRGDVDEAKEQSDRAGHERGSQGAEWTSSKCAYEMERGIDLAPLIFDEEPYSADRECQETACSLSPPAQTKSNTVLSPEHPDTLTNMANLVSTDRNQGPWKEAEELEA
jgi:hypothetical protein